MKPSRLMFIFLTIFLLIRLFEEAASEEIKFKERDEKGRTFGLRIPALPAFLTVPLSSLAQKAAFIGLKVASLVILILIIATLHNKNRRIDVEDEELDYGSMLSSYAGLTSGMPYSPVAGKQMLPYYPQQYPKYPPIELKIPKAVAPIPQPLPPTKFENHFQHQYKQPVNVMSPPQRPSKDPMRNSGRFYKLQERPQLPQPNQVRKPPPRPNRRPNQKLPKFPKIPPPDHYDPEHYKGLLLPSDLELSNEENPPPMYPKIRTMKIKLGERPRTPQGYQPLKNSHPQVSQHRPRPQSNSKPLTIPQTYSIPVQRPQTYSRPAHRPQTHSQLAYRPQTYPKPDSRPQQFFNASERRPQNQGPRNIRPSAANAKHHRPSVRNPQVQRPSSQESRLPVSRPQGYRPSSQESRFPFPRPQGQQAPSQEQRLPIRRPQGQRAPTQVTRLISPSPIKSRPTHNRVQIPERQKLPSPVSRPMSQTFNARRPNTSARNPHEQRPTPYLNSPTNQLKKQVPRRPQMTIQSRPQSLPNPRPQVSSKIQPEKPLNAQFLFEKAKEAVPTPTSPLDAFGLQPAHGDILPQPESTNLYLPVNEPVISSVSQPESPSRPQPIHQETPEVAQPMMSRPQNEHHVEVIGRPPDNFNHGSPIPVIDVKVNISRPYSYPYNENDQFEDVELPRETPEIDEPRPDESFHEEFESQPNHFDQEARKEKQLDQDNSHVTYPLEEGHRTSAESETYANQETNSNRMNDYSEIPADKEILNEPLENNEETDFPDDIPLPPERFYNFDGDNPGFREEQFSDESESNHNVRFIDPQSLPDSWDETQEWQYTNSESNPNREENEQPPEYGNYQETYSSSNVDHSANGQGYQEGPSRRSEDHFSNASNKMNDTVSENRTEGSREKGQSPVEGHSLPENGENKTTSDIRGGRAKRSSDDGTNAVYHLVSDIPKREGHPRQIRNEEEFSTTRHRKKRSVDLGVIFEMIKFAHPTPIVYERAIQTLPKIVASLKREFLLN